MKANNRTWDERQVYGREMTDRNIYRDDKW